MALLGAAIGIAAISKPDGLFPFAIGFILFLVYLPEIFSVLFLKQFTINTQGVTKEWYLLGRVSLSWEGLRASVNLRSPIGRVMFFKKFLDRFIMNFCISGLHDPNFREIRRLLIRHQVISVHDAGWGGDFSEEERACTRSQIPVEPTSLSKWWQYSYLREIYVVRAKERILACLIPWFGAALSDIALFIFTLALCIAWSNPALPLEELTERRGKLIEYDHTRRGPNLVTFLLEDGSKWSLVHLWHKIESGEPTGTM